MTGAIERGQHPVLTGNRPSYDSDMVSDDGLSHRIVSILNAPV